MEIEIIELKADIVALELKQASITYGNPNPTISQERDKVAEVEARELGKPRDKV